MASKKGIKQQLHSYIVETEKKLIPAYSAALKKKASSLGWSQETINGIRIAHDGNTPLVVYKQDISQQFNDQEYGTPDSPMKPAIRTFIWGDR